MSKIQYLILFDRNFENSGSSVGWKFSVAMVQLCKIFKSIHGSMIHTCAQHTMTVRATCTPYAIVQSHLIHYTSYYLNRIDHFFLQWQPTRVRFIKIRHKFHFSCFFPTPVLLLLLLLLFPLNEGGEREKHIVFNETIVFL